MWLPTASIAAAQRSFCSGLPGARELGAIDDLGGTELAQVGGLLGLAGRGDDAMPEPRQQRDRDAADAAARAGDEHLAVAGSTPWLSSASTHEHRGVAGGADRHRLAGRDRRRQRNQPIALQPRPLGQAAPARLADAPAVVDDPIARRSSRMARLEHGAGAVDAGDHRPGANDRAAAGDRQAVLVVERRMLDAHRDVALRQSGFVDVAHPARKPASSFSSSKALNMSSPGSACDARYDSPAC